MLAGDPKPGFEGTIGWNAGDAYGFKVPPTPYYFCTYCGSSYPDSAWAALFCFVSHFACKECGMSHLASDGSHPSIHTGISGMHHIIQAAQCCWKYECRKCGDKHPGPASAAMCCKTYACPRCGTRYTDKYVALACCKKPRRCDTCCYHPDEDTGIFKCCCCGHSYEEDTGPEDNPELEWKIDKTATGTDPEMREYVRVSMADFYLLEYMGIAEHYTPAATRLAKFETRLAAEWSAYLDRAIGGEFRHAYKSHVALEIRGFIKNYRGRGRSTAWEAWAVLRKQYGLKALEFALDAFNDRNAWTGEGYGGEAWANCAKVLLAYLKHEIPARIFIDRCCSLEHNGGCVFNKAYLTDWVEEVLEAHSEGKFNVLLRHCSPEVYKLWRTRHWREFEGRSEEYRQAVAPETLDYTVEDVLAIEREAVSTLSRGMQDLYTNDDHFYIDRPNTYYSQRRNHPSRWLKWEKVSL